MLFYQKVDHFSSVVDTEKGSLHELLHDTAHELIWLARINIALGISGGLNYLHEQNILYRDLKSLNILIDKNYQAKLSDFGLAKIELETNSTRSKVMSVYIGSICWKAPELFKPKAIYTEACDVYSLGMVLWELVTRSLPFADASDDTTVISWVKEGEQEDIPTDCPAELASLIKTCWSNDPTQRPTAEAMMIALEAIQLTLVQQEAIEAEKAKQAEKSRTKALESQISAIQLENTSMLEKLTQEIQQ